MILIPKGKRYYHGIGLVEVIRKVVAAILNRRLTASITFHNFLHGFRAGCGMGTAEKNLITPWIGPDASRSWKAAVWDPEYAGFSGHTGVG